MSATRVGNGAAVGESDGAKSSPKVRNQQEAEVC